jgi:Ca2+-binding RTX toxin-like protein
MPVPEKENGPVPPAQISVADVWDLQARTDLVDRAATGWHGVATAITGATNDVDAKAGALVAGTWTGEAAETFDAHRRKLVADLEDTAGQARSVATALGKTAGSIGAAQGHLTDEWGRVIGVPFTYDSPRHLLFSPRTVDESKVVLGSIEACGQIRQDLDRQLAADVSDYWKARSEFQRIAAVWLSQASGAQDPFTLPPEATATGIIYDGNRVFVNTGPGDDDVRISVDPRTGLQIVTINGIAYGFPAGADIVVRAGQGNDSLTVAPGTNLHVTLIGGVGDDQIHGGSGDDTLLGLSGQDRLYGSGGDDRVSAGADRDYVDGGAGNDILTAGLGDDTVYGLAGNDALDGGEGQDYLEGATGNDTVAGGAGNDIISGGRDDDTLRGGAGDDKIYAGLGHDVSDGGRGADTVFGEKGDVSTGAEQNVTVEIKDPGTFIKVEGSAEFRERVEADLDMMRSSPRGSAMLAALDQGHADTEGGWGPFHHDGDSLTIKEYNNPDQPNNSTATHSGRSNVIAYNPHLDNIPLGNSTTVDGPPSVVLYHEMAHVYDYMNDTLAPGDYQGPDNPGVHNREREAAGLPLDDGKIYPEHPYDLTENGLRDEMGAPHREAY